MNFINTKSFLLFSIASSTLFSAAPDSECDTVYASLANPLGGDCTAAEGSDQCPASCQESLDEVLTVCGAEGATLDGETVTTLRLLIAADMFIEPPCEEAIQKKIMEESGNTCGGWAGLYLSTSGIPCGEGTTCSQFCKVIQDGFYSTCASNDKIMVETQPTSARQFGTTVELFLSESCKEYAGGKTFSSSSSLSVSAISVVLSLVVSSFYLFA